jgi:paraquat-inducible protein A
VGLAFRYSEVLDIWAMLDVLLIGGCVGYGRVASQIPVEIDIGGLCLIGAALMTMVTRASLERRAVWRRVMAPQARVTADALACTSCDIVLPPDADGRRCPRCAAPVRRRRPAALMQCSALVMASWLLMPVAYGFPMSAFWEAGTPHPHTIIDGIILLFSHGFWPFGILIFLVSLCIPIGKLVGLTWFIVSVRIGSSSRLRRKTQLFRVIDEIGRWSTLDPFTVMIFAPMVQFGQIAHIDVMGGSPAFMAVVVLSMLAARVFDPRLMWDAAAESRRREGELGQARIEAEPAAVPS